MLQTAITIITPCYNESVYAIRFLESLENTLSQLPFSFYVVVVNDCSSDDTLHLLKKFYFKATNISLRIVNLRFNVGHQGAIYQGFLYARTLPCNHFIVMDSDGEDSPAAIPELLRHLDMDIVNVVRSKRKESLLFRLFYRLYKIIFKFVTGKQMNFGNFCLINRHVLESAVFSSFSHFAAFLSKQKNPACYIVAHREERIGGQSKMGFKRLFYHAFKSFVEYGEDMLMLFFKGFIIIMAVLLVAIGNVVYQKFIAHTAILGWTSVVIIGLVNLAIICIGFFVLGILLINLNNQNPNSKVPIYELHADEIAEEAI
jgi:glycosyltransferase involved in cell wall biosynthesis